MTNTTDIFATLASAVGYSASRRRGHGQFRHAAGDARETGRRQVDPAAPPTQSFHGEFQIRQGKWKYLDHKGSGGNEYEGDLRTAMPFPNGPDAPGQFYDLAKDPGETTNLYFTEEAKRKELQALLKKLKQDGRSAPKGRLPVAP